MLTEVKLDALMVLCEKFKKSGKFSMQKMSPIYGEQFSSLPSRAWVAGHIGACFVDFS